MWNFNCISATEEKFMVLCESLKWGGGFDMIREIRDNFPDA